MLAFSTANRIQVRATDTVVDVRAVADARPWEPWLLGELFAATVEAIGPPDAGARAEARRRQARLTKPEGSLGRLEELAVTLAASPPTRVR